MGHFAKVTNGTVQQVIVAEQEFVDSFADLIPGEYIQVSYNTRGGVHYGPDGQPDGGTALRANYPGVGFVYDAEHDVFYAPQPFPSWTISEPDWIWQPPVPKPQDGKLYAWDEAALNWVSLN